MTWFEKIIPSRIKTERRTRSVPEGLWMKCPACCFVTPAATVNLTPAAARISLSHTSLPSSVQV